MASNFIKDARSAASDWGVPKLRPLSLPSDKWYTLGGPAEELQPVAADAIDEIIDILTRPLTPEEANVPKSKDADIGPAEFSVSATHMPRL